MLFGANKDKGLIFNGIELEVVKVGEGGVSVDEVLTHDAHAQNPVIHFLLAGMKYPDYPVALGVIRDVEAPNYDSEVERQIEEVKATSKITCVDDLLRSGSTWEVK